MIKQKQNIIMSVNARIIQQRIPKHQLKRQHLSERVC